MCHICKRKYYLQQAKIMDSVYHLQKRLYKEAAEELYPEEDEVCEEGGRREDGHR
jgi:ATP-dependent exoDNAse (exonuclease V) beta subunit